MAIGVVGAGSISTQYLENLTQAPDARVAMVADLDIARAADRAKEYGVGASGTTDDLLARDDIELVVNLTIPDAHVAVGLDVLRAGKHVYGEKPLGLSVASGRELLTTAAERGLRAASAPDTVLGPGVQAGLRALKRGEIGTPLTALALFQVAGPESWHPSPEFLFARGGGPLFDMGPYYLTVLVMALGPARKVHAVGSRAWSERVIGSGPRAGTRFPVEVPTHIAGLIEFASGASATVVFSFESALQRSGVLEVTGTEGTLVLPDPNTFGGPVGLWRAGAAQAVDVPIATERMTRGFGVIELARAIRQEVPERCSGELALHVLEVMEALQESAEHGTDVSLTTTVALHEPLPQDWDPLVATL